MENGYLRRRSYWESSEEFEQRCRQRLVQELGIDEADLEVVLHLRRQVAALRKQVLELEAELTAQQRLNSSRRAQSRQITIEATWYEAGEE